ncbi:LPS-assembly protein LptD, partial [Novosphingobium sp. KN65.2]|uniref:LPS-assembly protein LptD n=1 Tax=Novosphingobium sp. KN65.2 TaxID=1478134 RepID=UPI000AA1181B
MLPAAQIPQQASHRRLRPVSLGILAAGIATFTLAPGAYAQDAVSSADTAAPAGTEEKIPIAFEADTVEYDQNADSVTASGNVVLRREQQSVRADSVTWNRQSGQIVASGNVRLVDENGNQLYTDRIELTDELKTGAMQNLLLAMREGGRLPPPP